MSRAYVLSLTRSLATPRPNQDEASFESRLSAVLKLKIAAPNLRMRSRTKPRLSSALALFGSKDTARLQSANACERFVLASMRVQHKEFQARASEGRRAIAAEKSAIACA